MVARDLSMRWYCIIRNCRRRVKGVIKDGLIRVQLQNVGEAWRVPALQAMARRLLAVWYCQKYHINHFGGESSYCLYYVEYGR